jgi:hypothetical protein
MREPGGASEIDMRPQRKMRGRDARNAKRAEQAYLAQNAPQQCVVCGKWFVRQADKVCSRDCAAKLEAQAKER